MADELSGFERQRLGAFLRGPMEKTPTFLQPDVVQALRDVKGLYFPGESRPVGATPAMQSAVQGQPLPAAGEPVRPAPAMRTLAQGVGPRVQAPGYSGMGWSAPTATEVPGLGSQSATPDMTTRYSASIGPNRPPPPVGEIAQKMQDPRGLLSDMIRKMGVQPLTGSSETEASNLRKVAGAAGLAGAALTGGVGAWLRRTPAAIPVIEAGGIAEGVMDPESRLNQAARRTRESVREAYRTEGLPAAIARQVGAIAPMAYETLGAAGAPFARMSGSALRNLAVGAGISETPAQAMARAREIYERDISPTRQRQLPEMNVPRASFPAGARAQAPEEPQTVRVYRGGGGGGLTTTYDVSQGAPLGKVLSVEGMAPGLTPEEHLYNQQALRSAQTGAEQQEYSARALRNFLRTPRPVNQATAQMITALEGVAGPGIAPIRPQMTKPIKAPTAGDDVTRAGYAMSQQIDQAENDFAARVQQMQAANPRLTPEQIAADPQIRQNRLRKQRLQDQFNRMIELTSKRLPTLDQVMATGGLSGE